MSPLLGFTKLKKKLLDGTKTQTIRKPRKHPVKIGDKLYIYWKLRTKQCQKLGEGVVIKIVRKPLEKMTDEDARLDGFLDIVEFMDVFTKMHPAAYMDSEFDIITWDWICRKCNCQIRGVAHKSPEATICMNCYLKELKVDKTS